ncbi:MAG TPA: adenosylmethionine--8-amino-7-oxononanoate transaminase [Nitrososphaera sp.]|nr:adenosylmethionine--8-amino-7-oxononanoate transaminase [Nitrososphaera sp.]
MRSLKEADREFVWHPYTQMSDWNALDNRVIVRGKDFYLLDSEGRKYLDGIASMWCNVWGHGRNEVVEAMIEQMKNLQHSTLFGLANGPSAQLAEKLSSLARGMDKTFYTDNGSTAVEAAMKMALQYWRNKGKRGKTEFVALERGYHGDTIGAMSVGYVESFFAAYKPLLTIRVHRVPSPLVYGSGFENEKDLMEHCLAKTENLLKKRSDRCAALVMESGAQIAGGVVIYPDGYQKKIARMCNDHDVLLILDEIATGFGRLGNMVEYLAQGSFPDIVCFGKALTGGYFPLAVTMTTERIFNGFLGKYSDNKHFYHGHTFTGHPVGCAAALANIELYRKRNLVQKINANARYIASRLQESAKSPIVADIRHKGMLAGIELAKNNDEPILTLRNRQNINYFITQESLKLGVHLRSLGNIMMIIPPLAIGRQDLERLMDVHLEILRKAERLS